MEEQICLAKLDQHLTIEQKLKSHAYDPSDLKSGFDLQEDCTRVQKDFEGGIPRQHCHFDPLGRQPLASHVKSFVDIEKRGAIGECPASRRN